ncbi:MAG TPA: hypothetical protein VF691_17525 [Cytophagaceae bacterium]|jgi:hypothetical protein
MKKLSRPLLAIALFVASHFQLKAQTSGGWSYSGTKTYTNPLGNLVGIGTTNPLSNVDILDANNPSIDLRFDANNFLQLGISTDAAYYAKAATPADALMIYRSNRASDLILGIVNSAPSADNGAIRFITSTSDFAGETERMTIMNNGKVSIGTSSEFTKGFPGTYKLYVSDGILTEKVKVAVKTTADWSDFVFDRSYKLPPLSNVEKFINKNHHLPEIPSAENVVTNGLDLAEMDAKLLQKIEELTLYIIQQDKKITELEKKISIKK